jgi:hypothetical protein
MVSPWDGSLVVPVMANFYMEHSEQQALSIVQQKPYNGTGTSGTEFCFGSIQKMNLGGSKDISTASTQTSVYQQKQKRITHCHFYMSWSSGCTMAHWDTQSTGNPHILICTYMPVLITIHRKSTYHSLDTSHTGQDHMWTEYPADEIFHLRRTFQQNGNSTMDIQWALNPCLKSLSQHEKPSRVATISHLQTTVNHISRHLARFNVKTTQQQQPKQFSNIRVCSNKSAHNRKIVGQLMHNKETMETMVSTWSIPRLYN